MGDRRFIVVLGVGNTMMQDDGVGVWAVRSLAEGYTMPPGVRLIEGGVAGFCLLAELYHTDSLLIIDAMEGEGPPGSLYRLCPEGLPVRQGPLFSAHEIGIGEVLSVARFRGSLPPTLIIGVQPVETRQAGTELTPLLRAALPRVVAAVVEELRARGVEMTKKEESPHA